VARVRARADVGIERGGAAVVILRPATPEAWMLSESIRIAKELGSTATLDDQFGRDMEHVIASHRESGGH